MLDTYDPARTGTSDTADGLNAILVSAPPPHEDVVGLRSAIVDRYLKDDNFKKSEKTLKDKVSAPHIGAPFPEKVPYQLHCGPMCKTDFPAGIVHAQKKLVDYFVSVVKAAAPENKISAITVATPLYVLEVSGDCGDDGLPRRVRWFVSPSEAAGSWHRYQAQVQLSVFECTSATESNLFEGWELEQVFHDHIKPFDSAKVPEPYSAAVGEGAPLSVNLGELGAELWNFKVEGEDVWAKRLTCARLRYRVRIPGFHRLTVLGVIQPNIIDIHVSNVFVAPADPSAPKHACYHGRNVN